MQKCQDMRNLDTCDYLKSYLLVRGGCQSDDDDSQSELYTFFFRHTKPRMSCPIKAGSYRIQSFPFPIEDNYVSVSESKISTSVFGYTYTIEGILERNKVTCLVAHMQLIYIHPHGVAADGDRAAGNSLENEY
ncbi:hypothetical protein evm_005999 [Chilo suppressalis]|nr:hypothetical protein evm_005999 [Chilo suppressalis]